MIVVSRYTEGFMRAGYRLPLHLRPAENPAFDHPPGPPYHSPDISDFLVVVYTGDFACTRVLPMHGEGTVISRDRNQWFRAHVTGPARSAPPLLPPDPG